MAMAPSVTSSLRSNEYHCGSLPETEADEPTKGRPTVLQRFASGWAQQPIDRFRHRKASVGFHRNEVVPSGWTAWQLWLQSTPVHPKKDAAAEAAFRKTS